MYTILFIEFHHKTKLKIIKNINKDNNFNDGSDKDKINNNNDNYIIILIE